MAKKRQGPIKEDKSNKTLLIGAGVGIAAVIALIVFVGKGSSKEESAPVSRHVPAVKRSVAKSKPGRETSQTKQVPAIPAMPTPDNIKQIYKSVEEYLSKYSQAEDKIKWGNLGQWAMSRGLYVEAYHCMRNSGLQMMPSGKTHKSVMLLKYKGGKWKLLSQGEFESRFTLPASGLQQSYQQVSGELNKLESGEGISSQTFLANLLIKADTPRGRKLYEENIGKKGFYPLLVRELEREFLSQFGDKKIWQGGWYKTGSMNLWLIDKLIDFSPPSAVVVKDKKTKGKKRAKRAQREMGGPGGAPMGMGPMGGPGMPGMMPGGMPGRKSRSRMSLTPAEQAALDHKLLLLRVLSRRGGVASSYLMSKIIKADKDNLIFKGLISGKVDFGIFLRFTGVYAEPLVGALQSGLEKYKSSQSEWSVIAGLLSRMHNDRAAHLVFASAQAGKLKLSSDMALNLAAEGTSYRLKNLSEFVKASQVEGIDVESLFSAWAEPGLSSGKSFWDLFSGFLPEVLPEPKAKKSRKRPTAMPQMAGHGGEMMPPEGMGPMPGMGPGGPEQMPGMPGGRPRKMRASKKRQKRAVRGTNIPERGWPVEYRFVSSVNKRAAIEFLQTLGKIKITEKKEGKGKGKAVRRRAVTRQPKSSQGELTQIKKSALRCLVSLPGKGEKDYFTSLVDDKNVGGLARLGLCVLDDKTSAPVILKHFWSNPLELADCLKDKGSKSVSASDKIKVSAGKISVPLNEIGLTKCGISAREALIYFDYRQAGEAFLAALGEFITRKEPYDNPEQVCEAASQLIEAVGCWKVEGIITTLADLIASIGDFGLRGKIRGRGRGQVKNPLATRVRVKALEVLGRIGDSASLNIILQLAIYEQEDAYLAAAAKIALAKRGVNGASGMFLDILDPQKAKPSRIRGQKDISKLISQIDPSLKNETDAALLGLSRVKLNSLQINRAIEILKNLGASSSRTKTKNLQERFILSLISAGQGEVLSRIAKLIVSTDENYYWNKQKGKNRDESFLKMIQMLAQIQIKDLPDKTAAIALIKSVLLREEQMVLPKQDKLTSWKPEQSLIQFKDSISVKGSDMMKPKSGGQSKLDNHAAIAGLELLSTISDPRTQKRILRNLKFYRYLASFMVYKPDGDRQGNDLSKLLASATSNSRDIYILFRAVEQMETSKRPELIPVFAKAISRTSNPVIRARFADAAMNIAVQSFADQIAGKINLLYDSKKMIEFASPWKSVVEHGSYDLLLSNPMVAALSVLQTDKEIIGWIGDIIDSQVKKSNPVSEEAVGYVVNILHGLNKKGNEETLNLYVDILNLVLKTDRNVKKRPKKHKLAPGGGFGGLSRRRRSGPDFAYVTVGPMIIEAIGDMSLEPVLGALKKLAKARPDLLGLIAIEVYKKDLKTGKAMMKQSVRMGGKNPELSEQIKIILSFLMANPTPFGCDILSSAIAKSDTSVGEFGLGIFAKLYEAGKLPKGVNAAKIMRGILRGLLSKIRNDKSASGLLDKVVKLAKSMHDPELNKILTRIAKYKDKTQRQSKRKKGRTGRKRKGRR